MHDRKILRFQSTGTSGGTCGSRDTHSRQTAFAKSTEAAMGVCTVQQASELARVWHKPFITVQMYLSKAFEITRSAVLAALSKQRVPIQFQAARCARWKSGTVMSPLQSIASGSVLTKERTEEPKRNVNRKEARKSAKSEIWVLLNGSASNMENKYNEWYKGTYDIFFETEHMMRKEETEEKFNKEAKQGWMFAADATGTTEETASSEDCKHTPGGVCGGKKEPSSLFWKRKKNRPSTSDCQSSAVVCHVLLAFRKMDIED